MFSIQQIIIALRRLRSHSGGGGNFAKSLKWAVLSEGHYHLPLPPPASAFITPTSISQSELAATVTSSMLANESTCIPRGTRISPEQRQQAGELTVEKQQHQQQRQHDDSNENMKSSSSSDGGGGGVYDGVVSSVGVVGGGCDGGGCGGGGASVTASASAIGSDGGASNEFDATDVSPCSHLNEVNSVLLPVVDCEVATNHDSVTTAGTAAATVAAHLCNRSQQIQKFYQQQLHQFHTQHNNSRCAKQKLTHFRMASLAAEPLSLKASDMMGNNIEGAALATSTTTTTGTTTATTAAAAAAAAAVAVAAVTTPAKSTTNDSGHHNETGANLMSSSSPAAVDSDRTCLKTGLAEILRFMELIGNLKHTKRTGWVLRDVDDCESISGHMYRMSMMTFLLDGSEGLNQIRCMELALVHDLAESLVGDITPFCGISKEDKRAMELKAMSDICKLIEPRGKRIMELFEEYELGESEESKFVKDLDRLDMVMQAFEYEKRDNCLLKHQEFFDSTAGKFKHPFVKKLVTEIYEQRNSLAKAVGAKPPPTVVVVPNWDLPMDSSGAGGCDHSLGTKDSS